MISSQNCYSISFDICFTYRAKARSYLYYLAHKVKQVLHKIQKMSFPYIQFLILCWIIKILTEARIMDPPSNQDYEGLQTRGLIRCITVDLSQSSRPHFTRNCRTWLRKTIKNSRSRKFENFRTRSIPGCTSRCITWRDFASRAFKAFRKKRPCAPTRARASNN
jgi:hypothetical protein